MKKLIERIFRKRKNNKFNLKHYIKNLIITRKRNVKQIINSGLFDEDFYNLQFQNKKISNPIKHYLLFGAIEGINPNPFFDTNWYRNTYGEVNTSGINPLLHYIRIGSSKNYDPSPFFDITWYRMQYQNIIGDREPLEFFLHTGWYQNTKTTKNLDYDKYFDSNSSLKIRRPFTHPILKKLDTHYEKQVIKNYPNINRAYPKISVVITTYNHEKFICKCLQSVIEQRGDFSMEIIIGDDCSQDNTKLIIQKFKEKYPKLIKLIINESNGGITNNYRNCFTHSKGNYIAICEGDDFWIDKLKLQKQLQLLKDNPSFSMCFSELVLLDEKTNCYTYHNGQRYLKKKFLSTEDLIRINYIGNLSCCFYRKEWIESLPSKIYKIGFADWLLNLTISQFGKIGYLDSIMSVYRIHENGLWSSRSLENMTKRVRELCEQYNAFFDYQYNDVFQEVISKLV